MSKKVSADKKDQAIVPAREAEMRSIMLACCEYDKFNLIKDSAKRLTVAKIERGILNFSIDEANRKNLSAFWQNERFLEIYNSNCYRVKVNIDVNSYVNIGKPDETRYYLITRICNFIKIMYLTHIQQQLKMSDNVLQMISGYMDFIDPEKLGSMNSFQLNPLINKSYIDELELRNNQKVELKYSEMYKCDNCGKRKTSQNELQTRSGDEGSTLFITCLGCGHGWKIYG